MSQQNVYGVLEWRNEHSTSGYPLSLPLFIPDLIVDANFVQFKGGPPMLVSIAVTALEASIVISVNSVSYTLTLAKPTVGYTADYSIKIFDSLLNYIGVVVFGNGVNALFDRFTSTSHVLNIPFLPICLTELSEDEGVYSLDGLYGAVKFDTLDGGVKHIWTDITDNLVKWNAVTIPPVQEVSALKTINGVSPRDNNIVIQDDPILRFIAVNDGLNVQLATTLADVKILATTTYGS